MKAPEPLVKYGSIIAIVCALACAALAHAQQTRETFTSVMRVTLDIIGACTVSADDLNFGRYSSQTPAPQLGQSALRLRCSEGLALEIALDAGRGPGATTTQRKLMSGADVLTYSLYQDVARQQIWGDVPGTDTLSVQATGTDQSIPIYGRIPASQSVAPGEYGDVITVRLLY